MNGCDTMEYKKLNAENKTRMKQEINSDLEFEWEDRKLLDILLMQFERLNNYAGDPKDLEEFIRPINSCINDFNRRKIKYTEFLSKMKKMLKKTKDKYPDYSYRFVYDYEYYRDNISLGNRVLINGEAGIGKSYYLFQLEEELEKSKAFHLCIYCKYTKKIPANILKEIEGVVSRRDFVLIIDAFNELNTYEKRQMLNILEKLNSRKNIRIIVSYRTNTITTTEKKKLETILKNKYEFKGVSYDSGIANLIETYGVNIANFQDVLSTNNPLYLRMLYSILLDKKLVKKQLNNLSSITFILEQYIKKNTNNETWELTKIVSNYLYNNNKWSISKKELQKLLNGKFSKYVKIMEKENLLDQYIGEGETNYIFKLQTLSDYIISRSLYNDLDKTDDEIIKIINSKISKNYSLRESFILIIFDKFSTNIRRALKIIFKSNLEEHFDLKIFRRINITDAQAKEIQNILHIGKDINNLFELGGFYNKPFNCVNYYNRIFLNDPKAILSVGIEYYFSDVLPRIKNSIYNFALINNDNEYVEEIFWFSFWLTSSPNKRIRDCSIKLIFDIVNKFERYIDELVNVYPKIDDDYIKKSIVHVLTALSIDYRKKLSNFFQQIINDESEINSEIISRVTYYMFDDFRYINYKKRNIYNEIDNAKPNDLINKLIYRADIYEKYVFKFNRYNKSNELSLYDNFVLNDKKVIRLWNNVINTRFECIKDNGFCKGYNVFEEIKKIVPLNDLIEMGDDKKFLIFQKVLEEVVNKYEYDINSEEVFDERLKKFSDSKLRKCLMIAQDRFFGSLMCNYYTKEFISYYDDKILGISPYKAINFDEEELEIKTPISLFNEDADNLSNKIISRLELYGKRDKKWYNNKYLSIKNIQKLCQPFKYKGNNWRLLSADIHVYFHDKDKELLYTELYDFSISVDSTRILDGTDDSRNLTIETERYNKNVKDYVSETNCDKVMNIPQVLYNSYDFKETHLSFPPSAILKELNLKYNSLLSTWKKGRDDVIICDNNRKSYYKTPITNAIYIREDYYKKIESTHSVKFWAFTEKNYKKLGFNDESALHIEMNSDGKIISKFKNYSPKEKGEEFNIKCHECPFGIYEEWNKDTDFSLENLLINIKES